MGQIGGSTASLIAGDYWQFNNTCGTPQTKLGTITYFTDKCHNIRNEGFTSYYCNSTTIVKKICETDSCSTGCVDVAFYPTGQCVNFTQDETDIPIFANLFCNSAFIHPPPSVGMAKLNISEGCGPEQNIYSTRTARSTCLEDGNGGSFQHGCKWSQYKVSYFPNTKNCTGESSTVRDIAHRQCDTSKPGAHTYLTTCSLGPTGPSPANITGNIYYDGDECKDPRTISGKFYIQTDVAFPSDLTWSMLLCNGSHPIQRNCRDKGMTLECGDLDLSIPTLCSDFAPDESGNGLYGGQFQCSNAPFPGGVSRFSLAVDCVTPYPYYRSNTRSCVYIPELTSTTGVNVSRIYDCINGTAVYTNYLMSGNVSDCTSLPNNTVTTLSVGQCEMGTTLLECNTPWELICYGVAASMNGVCSGQGTCVAKDVCSCKTGWTGFNCSQVAPANFTMFGSSSPIIAGDFWQYQGNCSGSNIGMVTYKTDTCIERAGKTLVFGCNSTHILIRKCSNGCNSNCTENFFVPNTCIQIDVDENGVGIMAQMSCNSNFLHPQITTGMTRLTISETCAKIPYSERTYLKSCKDIGGNVSISHDCSNYVFRKNTHFESDVCAGSMSSNTLTHLDCSLIGDQAIRVVRCGPSSTQPSDLLFIGGPLFYDSTCKNNLTIGGTGWIDTDFVHQSSIYWQRWLCRNGVVGQQRCTDPAMTTNCADVSLQIGTCNSFAVDETGVSLFVASPKCVGTILYTGSVIQVAPILCTDPPQPFSRANTRDCVFMPTESTGAFNVSRIYGCDVNGTFYDEWRMVGNISTCMEFPPNFTSTTILQQNICVNGSRNILRTCNPPDFICNGISSTNPTVCSGRGDCIGPNQCVCNLGYIGTFCDQIVQSVAPNQVLNLTGSLTGTQLTVGNTSALVISSGSTVNLANSTLNIAGSMSINAGTVNLAGTSINIGNGGTLTISSNSILIGDGRSSLESSGTITLTSTSGGAGTTILVKIINKGTFEISGSGFVNLTDSIAQSDTATFTSLNSNITASKGLNIKNGFVNLSGKVTSPVVTITDSLVKSPRGLNLQGSMNLNSTMIFNVDSISQLNQLVVSNNFNLYSTVILKLGPKFAPNIGDELNIIPAAADFLISGKFIMVGGPSKTSLTWNVGTLLGDYNRDTLQVATKRLTIKVTYSIGDEKSTCHYLGTLKNLEFYLLEKQASLSFVVPASTDSTGYAIGWNDKPVLNNQKLVYFSNGTVNGTVSTNGDYLIDSVVKIIPQIFGLGPAYKYINILIPRGLLVNQTHLFYIETTSSINLLNTSLLTPDVFQFAIGSQSSQDCTNFVAPFRAEIYSIAGTVILLVIYVGLFLASLFYTVTGSQPMASRGVSPYFVLFFCFVQLLTEIRNYFYPTTAQASLCLFYSYLYYPALQSCYIVILFYYIRYFLIINMNEIKNSVTNEDHTSLAKARRYILLIKIILSKWGILGYLAFSYILVNLLFTIVLASNNYVCSFNILLALKILHCIELIVIYALILVAIIFDMAMNYKKLISGQFLNYIYGSDPFYFRVQIILFMIYLVYQFVIDIVILATTSTYIATLTNFYLISVLNTVSCIFLILIDSVFPLVLSIWHHFLYYFEIEFFSPTSKFPIIIKRRYHEKETSNVILKVLNDEKGYLLFNAFCKSEFSVENIMCWTDIQKFKSDPNLQAARDFQFTYLMGARSAMEINVPGTHCKRVADNIDKSEVTEDLLNEIEKGIMVNLSDTYYRFQATNVFKSYEMILKTQKEMLDMGPNQDQKKPKKTIIKPNEPVKEAPKETIVAPVEEKPVEKVIEETLVPVEENSVVPVEEKKQEPVPQEEAQAPPKSEPTKTILWSKKKLTAVEEVNQEESAPVNQEIKDEYVPPGPPPDEEDTPTAPIVIKEEVKDDYVPPGPPPDEEEETSNLVKTDEIKDEYVPPGPPPDEEN